VPKALRFVVCLGFALAACDRQQSGNDDEVVDTTLNDGAPAIQTMNVDENLSTESTVSSRDRISDERPETVGRSTDSAEDDGEFAEAPYQDTRGASRAIGRDIRTIFSADDYPASALAAGAEGTAQATLTISPDGRVVGCELIQSTGNGALDAATCNIIHRRALFAPARDANGQPTTDTMTTPPITWRLSN